MAAAGGGGGRARPSALAAAAAAAAVAAFVAAPVPAFAAAAGCPPELLARLLDQGYGREDVLRLCGDAGPGAGAAAGSGGAGAGTAAAFARLQELTARLERECRAAAAGARSDRRGTGPCDLHAQYADIQARWRAGQAKCAAGDEGACRVLAEAAAQLRAVDP